MVMRPPSSPPPPPSWSDRLRRSGAVVLVSAIAMISLVILHELTLVHALLVFLCIVGASLVPLQLADTKAPRDDAPHVRPAESEAVRALIAGMPDPAVLLDRIGRVLHLNTQASLLAPALRRNEPALVALRSPDIVAALRAAIATAQTQRATFVERVPLERWMELIVTPVAMPTDFGGVDHCFLMTFHDQTQLRRVEEMRVDFVANASHELRTPLAALSGFIDTLQGPARDDAEARERFLGIMQAQASRMARLIDDLLSLSRVELTAHMWPEAPVDLVPVLRQVIDGLEALAREREVVIEAHVPAAPVVIAGASEELLRLFENLIENGLKYGAQGGRVMVTLSLDEARQEARVAVRDFGPGIAAEHLPRLTERFYRADVGDSRAHGGTGLGLALVKHIANRHGGRLLIESVHGQGATFTVCFPLPRNPNQG